MRKALGRGLDALIPATSKSTAPEEIDGAVKVPIEKIRPNHMQPRKYFDPEKLSELAASIKEHGIAQPLVVTHDNGTDTYELVSGERRLRAAELAGLKEVDVVVRQTASDKMRLALALVENLQREDLNPIEEALGYLRLIKEAGLSKTELAQHLGKSQSAISNTLRLLNLPEEIQNAIQFVQITEGHARALLMVENPLERKRIFSMLIDRHLSVRDAEDLARRASSGSLDRTTNKKPRPKPADIKAIEDSLQHSLGTKVEIKTRKDPATGTITVHFYSLEEFENILKMLKK